MSETTKPAATQPTDTSIAGVPGPVWNVRYKFTFVFPDGKKQTRGGSVTGWITSVEEIENFLVPTILHTKPLRTTVENIRAVNRLGKDLRPERQPEIFLEYNRRHAAALAAAGGRRSAIPLADHLRDLEEDEGDLAFHPGVRGWKPSPPGVETYDAPDAPEPLGLAVPDPNKAVVPSGPQGPVVFEKPSRPNRK